VIKSNKPPFVTYFNKLNMEAAEMWGLVPNWTLITGKFIDRKNENGS
jgi:hypothetical protein